MRRGRGNPIPLSSRVIVIERDKGRCFKCGMRGSELSHRRRRGVKDGREHSPANLLLFCRTCHIWLHTNPIAAKEGGWEVSSYVDDMRDILVLRWDHAWVRVEDDGSAVVSYYSPR